MIRSHDPLVREFGAAIGGDAIDLAPTALIIAKLEYPALDPAPSLATLDRLGDAGRARVARVRSRSMRARAAALSQLLYEDEGFSGNRRDYGDFRNSLLNAVLERRLGIPITLALVYIEVAGRAGIDVQGVAFPGHFLMRIGSGLILDPFDAGVELNIADCRTLLAQQVGVADDDARFGPALLQPCSRRQMIARMLNNLKRTYVEARAFARARRVTDLLLVLDPTMLSELRDRALLAHHLGDYAPALRDLEDYLRLRDWKDDEEPDERERLNALVTSLRLRVAAMN